MRLDIFPDITFVLWLRRIVRLRIFRDFSRALEYSVTIPGSIDLFVEISIFPLLCRFLFFFLL